MVLKLTLRCCIGLEPSTKTLNAEYGMICKNHINTSEMSPFYQKEHQKCSKHRDCHSQSDSQVWVIKQRSVVGIYRAFVVCPELAKLCPPLVNSSSQHRAVGTIVSLMAELSQKILSEMKPLAQVPTDNKWQKQDFKFSDSELFK